MTRIAECVLTATLIGGLTGCATQQPKATQYVEPTEIVSGAPEQATMYDLESSAQQLIERMLSHPQFSDNYNAAKAEKGGKRPIVVIGNIVNKTTERIQGRLDAVGDTVRSALFSSSLFEVKDDKAIGAIIERITSGVDIGVEDGALVKTLGTHESPDFLVLGDFRHFADVGGSHTYRLRLAIHSLKTGKIVWEGVQTKVKL